MSESDSRDAFAGGPGALGEWNSRSETIPTLSTRRAVDVSAAFPFWFGARHPEYLAKHSKVSTFKPGLRYEARALAELNSYPWFLSHLPFKYLEGRNPRWRTIIPDGCAWVGERVFVFEIKLRNSVDGEAQLHNLYFPVVRRALPEVPIYLVEVIKAYDPWVKGTRDPFVSTSLAEIFKTTNLYNVWIFRG